MEQLFESIINSEWNENKELQDKTEKAEKSDEAAEIMCEFEQIIRLAYHQNKVFEKFKENVKFIDMVKQFACSELTIMFKITIVKLIKKHPQIKDSSLALNILKNYFQLIKEICEENACEF